MCLAEGFNYKISIHALRKECDPYLDKPDFEDKNISIHALRKECDMPYDIYNFTNIQISIHALRKECDILENDNKKALKNFYPRTP